MFARAISVATSEGQIVAARKARGAGTRTPSGQRIARLERELAALICTLPWCGNISPSSSPTVVSLFVITKPPIRFRGIYRYPTSVAMGLLGCNSRPRLLG